MTLTKKEVKALRELVNYNRNEAFDECDYDSAWKSKEYWILIKAAAKALKMKLPGRGE